MKKLTIFILINVNFAFFPGRFRSMGQNLINFWQKKSQEPWKPHPYKRDGVLDDGNGSLIIVYCGLSDHRFNYN